VIYRIESITTTIVDLPIRRPHGIGVVSMSRQSAVIVQLRTTDGVVGLGEGVVPGGGPQWGGESVETIQQIIDCYLAPALSGKSFNGVNEITAALLKLTPHNHFSVAAIEMAAWDLAGKYAGCSVAELLGGLQRDHIDVLWSIGGNVVDPLQEALEYHDAGHQTIKFMLGTRDPADDASRVVNLMPQLPAKTVVIIDCNGTWDEASAHRWLPALGDAGVQIAEQPLPAWDIAGSSRLAAKTGIQIMADEGICSIHDAFKIGAAHSAGILAIKVPKLGGVLAALKACGVAQAAGLAVYGGGTMETSIGTSAAAQLFGTFDKLTGCDLIGPLLMTDDIVTQPVQYKSGQLRIPQGAGLGVDLDLDKLNHYARS
jgi:muconate cycloisomerase